MNVYYSNINNFNEEIEEFVIAKNKIEQPLIDSEKIEKKMSIKEFIDYIDLSKSVYLLNDKENSVIPFNIQNPTENDIVVIYSSTIKDDKLIEDFKNNLKRIDFDLSKLTKHSQLDLLNGNFQDNQYFIINNEFYS